MATVEAAVTFNASASDAWSSEDLESTAMLVTLVEVREPIWIQLIEVSS